MRLIFLGFKERFFVKRGFWSLEGCVAMSNMGCFGLSLFTASILGFWSPKSFTANFNDNCSNLFKREINYLILKSKIAKVKFFFYKMKLENRGGFRLIFMDFNELSRNISNLFLF